ncbi:DUF6448 family protein [Geomonas propionica]|uniref:Uncharacterized protein n=1 Tax=Geomonas propionica TaxID=2798582 RepID=A0ABS0YP88_9BACT|nr:DUF6448 family protein [Geomonas propionica]MBJ6799786.1 hypothetical protein [Geomonas propionica]
MMGSVKITVAGIAAAVAVSLATPKLASAHCDTLDGPVVQDARTALETKNVTPVLKWVQAKDEKAVKAAFEKAVAAKGSKSEAAHKQFFATLVKVHRAGEGAPYTGLKPAGAVEPAVAEADKALATGSADSLVRLVTEDITAGIRKRYERTQAAYSHKDESVAQGREFVEAYVDFTHFVEKVHLSATGTAHGAHAEHTRHAPSGHGSEKH